MGERVRSDQVSDPNKVYGSIPSARGASPGMVQGAVWAETLQGDGDPPREGPSLSWDRVTKPPGSWGPKMGFWGPSSLN